MVEKELSYIELHNVNALTPLFCSYRSDLDSDRFYIVKISLVVNMLDASLHQEI